MPEVKVKLPQALKSFDQSRAVVGYEIRMQSLEMACERLMGLSQKNLQGKELKSALTAYKEITDAVVDERDLLERVQLMLKVIGQNLMSNEVNSS